MSPVDQSPTWRNRPVDRVCRHCESAFVGKYNSTVCPTCRERVRKQTSERFKLSNPDYWREWIKTPAGQECRRRSVLGVYDLSPEDWDSLYTDQQGGCAICGATGGWKANGGRLVTDHCHATGEVRGLLCPSCNRGLGQFEDNPDRLRIAAQYVEKITRSN